MTHKVPLFFEKVTFYTAVELQSPSIRHSKLAFMVYLHCEQDVTIIILRESSERKRDKVNDYYSAICLV